MTNYREDDPRDFRSDERNLFLDSRGPDGRKRADSPRAHGTSRFVNGHRVSGQNGIPGVFDGHVGRPASAASSKGVHLALSGGPVRPAVPSKNFRQGLKSDGCQSIIKASTDPADDPIRRGKNELLTIVRSGDSRKLIKAMMFVQGELAEIFQLKRRALRWALMAGPKRADFFAGKEKELEVSLATRKALVEQVIKIIINDGKDSVKAQQFKQIFGFVQDLLPRVFDVAAQALVDCKIITPAIKTNYEAQYDLDILEMAAELSKTGSKKSVGTTTNEPQAVVNPPCPATSTISSSTPPPSPPALTPDTSAAPSPTIAPSDPAIGTLALACGDNVLMGPIVGDFDMSIQIKARSNNTADAETAFLNMIVDPMNLVNALAAFCPRDDDDVTAKEGVKVEVKQEDSDEEL